MPRLPKAQIGARIEALEEAAGHLDLDWTDEPTEREEGRRLARRLRQEALRWHRELQKRFPQPKFACHHCHDVGFPNGPCPECHAHP